MPDWNGWEVILFGVVIAVLWWQHGYLQMRSGYSYALRRLKEAKLRGDSLKEAVTKLEKLPPRWFDA